LNSVGAPETLKAITYNRYGGPEVLEYCEVSDPVPGPDEALIAVECASVIPGDWKVRSGKLQDLFPVQFPTIPGRDGAGTVVAIGPNCNWADIGDELCFVTNHTEQGSYAELVTRPYPMTVPKPENIGFAEASSIVHAGVCAWIGLVETAKIAPGQDVLIHAGAGAIGGMAIQIAANIGCNVTATCRAENTSYARQLGADHAIPYNEVDFSDIVSEQDVVFDLVGGGVHERSCQVLRKNGMLVWLIANPFQNVAPRYGVRCQQVHIHDQRETLERVIGLASEGKLKPQVSQTMKLKDAAVAHRKLEQGKNTRGRIVLDVERT